MTDGQVDVYGGVDTHRDVHVAAAVNTAGQVLGSAPFRADPAGYEQMNNSPQGPFAGSRFLTKIGGAGGRSERRAGAGLGSVAPRWCRPGRPGRL